MFPHPKPESTNLYSNVASPVGPFRLPAYQCRPFSARQHRPRRSQVFRRCHGWTASGITPRGGPMPGLLPSERSRMASSQGFPWNAKVTRRRPDAVTVLGKAGTRHRGVERRGTRLALLRNGTRCSCKRRESQGPRSFHEGRGPMAPGKHSCLGGFVHALHDRNEA